MDSYLHTYLHLPVLSFKNHPDQGFFSKYVASIQCLCCIYLKQHPTDFFLIIVQVFDLYGVGLRQSFTTPNLLKELNLKVITPWK